MKFRVPAVLHIPTWVFLLCCLFGGIFVVGFGWTVHSTLKGSDTSGFVGRAAVAVAGFPSKGAAALSELKSLMTGDYKDAQFSVLREAGVDYSGFIDVAAADGLDVQGLALRADPAALTPGWRILTGAFQIDGVAQNAALLLSPDLKITKIWRLGEEPFGDFEPRPAHRKLVHGFEPLPDGSVVYTFDPNASLQRVSACGERIWAAAGNFHHAVTLTESGQSVWTFRGPGTLIEIGVEDGRVLRTVSLNEMIAANPEIDVLEVRRLHHNDRGRNSRNTNGEWLIEAHHFNDVDPLPAAIADRFEGFSAGDLLVSSRSLNLVFVVDPQTAVIKWWRVGATQRQHDPDWLATGEISVLNNRMSRDYSEIVAIDPTTYRRRVQFDGRQNDYYTRIRGKHQMLPRGDMIVTSPQQARAFEIDANGEIVLEIVNRKPGDDTANYVISEMRWLPLGYFDPKQWACG